MIGLIILRAPKAIDRSPPELIASRHDKGLYYKMSSSFLPCIESAEASVVTNDVLLNNEVN
jgi:hypothetical protein